MTILTKMLSKMAKNCQFLPIFFQVRSAELLAQGCQFLCYFPWASSRYRQSKKKMTEKWRLDGKNWINNKCYILLHKNGGGFMTVKSYKSRTKRTICANSFAGFIATHLWEPRKTLLEVVAHQHFSDAIKNVHNSFKIGV